MVSRIIIFVSRYAQSLSALGIPVPIGPNPEMWAYGVVAVLDERYGISNHPVTTVPP